MSDSARTLLVEGLDVPGVLASVAGVFARHRVFRGLRAEVALTEHGARTGLDDGGVEGPIRFALTLRGVRSDQCRGAKDEKDERENSQTAGHGSS